MSGDTKAGAADAAAVTDPRVVKLIGEAWRHAKAIGAVGDSIALAESGVTAEDEGVVIGTAKTVAPQMLELLAAHRVWQRFATSLDAATTAAE